MLEGPNGAVAAEMLRRGRRVQNRAKQLAPVDHGRLRADIQLELLNAPQGPFARVGNSVNYAIFVHEGTGIYGRRRRPIVPRRAKVLRFTAGGKVLFRPRVRGVRGRPYLRKALAAARG